MAKRHDQLSGLFWLAVSIFVCVQSSWGIDIGTFQAPGPGFFPFWAGVTLGCLTIIMMVTTDSKNKGKEELKDLWGGTQWYKVILVVIILLIYSIVTPMIGYLITTLGLMIFLFGIIGKIKLFIKIVSALVTVLITYLLFSWLGVQLPKGVFGL